MDAVTLFKELGRPEATAAWRRVLASLPDPAAAFGPGWAEHPRPLERTWAVVGRMFLGVGSLAPWPGLETVATYCVGLLPGARSRGLVRVVRRYLVDEAFRDPAVEVVRRDGRNRRSAATTRADQAAGRCEPAESRRRRAARPWRPSPPAEKPQA